MERAERLVRQGLRKSGWKQEHLGQTRKGDQVILARRDHMNYEWIANRLQMRSKFNVSKLVYRTARRTKTWEK